MKIVFTNSKGSTGTEWREEIARRVKSNTDQRAQVTKPELRKMSRPLMKQESTTYGVKTENQN